MKPKEIAKRIIALLLALIMAALCMACSEDGDGSDGDTETDGKETKAPAGDTTKAPDGDATKAPDAETSDKPAESTGGDVPDEPVIEEKKVTLEKCESTGEVGFDKISFDSYADERTNRVYFTNSPSDIFPFYHNGAAGYINDRGEIVLKDQWYSAGAFSEGKAFVTDSDGRHVIDTNGNVLYSFEGSFSTSISKYNDGTGVWESSYYEIPYFVNGVALAMQISQEDYYDFDDTHIMALTDKFDYSEFDCSLDEYSFPGCGFFYEGMPKLLAGTFPEYIVQARVDWDGTFTCIYNESGDLIYYGVQGEDFFYLGGGYVMTADKNIVDISTGEVLLKLEYEKCGMLSDGVIPVCSYDKWGLIDTEGNELIKPKFEYLRSFSHGLGFARDFDGNNLLVNKEGETVANLGKDIYISENLTIYPFTDSGLAFIAVGDLSDYEHADGYLINEKGEIVLSGQTRLFKYVSANYVIFDDDLYKVVVE